MAKQRTKKRKRVLRNTGTSQDRQAKQAEIRAARREERRQEREAEAEAKLQLMMTLRNAGPEEVKCEEPPPNIAAVLDARKVGSTDPAGTYNRDLAMWICDQVARGVPLVRVLEAHQSMPGRNTWWRWLGLHPSLGTQYARAREQCAEHYFAAIIRIAHCTTPLTAQADALAFKAFTWAAARLNPSAYGERMQHQHQHSGGLTHEHKITSDMTLEQASAVYYDFIKRPMPALPPPDEIEGEYIDVTPKKDAA